MFMIDNDGRRTWVDGTDGYNDLSDEKKGSLNSCPSYHPSNSVKSQVIESNCSTAQYNVNNQRRK